MADRRILTLLILFYDVCKDVLEEFFETTYCSGELTDSALSNYIREHAFNLYNHMTNSVCYSCSNSDNACIQFNPQQFMLFFTPNANSAENVQTPPLSSFSVKSLRVKDLNVIKLQYLLLAAELEPEKHEWLLTLRKQRLNISKLSWNNAVDDSTFNSIWKHGHEMVLNFAKTFKTRGGIKTVEKQMEFLKTTDLKYERARPYCHIMETEFDLQRVECMDQSINLQANVIIIGNNNVQQTIQDFPDEIKTQLQEVLHGQKHILDRLENMAIVGKINSEPQADNEAIEVEGATGGVTSLEDGKDLQYGQQNVDWTLQIPNDINTEDNREKISMIGPIEIEGHGNIVIKSVKKGSLIITTTMTGEILKNENCFLQAIHQFLTEIINVCKINTSAYSYLEVEIDVRQPTEVKEVEMKCKECAEKSELIQILENNLTRAKVDEKDTKYGKLFQTRYIKDQEDDSQSGFDTNFGKFSPYESSRKDIFYAEFPKVRVKALSTYLHIAEDKIVVTMKRGAVYYLVAEIGDWWEINEGSGDSFFILSEYAEYEDPQNSPKLKGKQNVQKNDDIPPIFDKQQTSQKKDIPSAIEDISTTAEHYDEIPYDRTRREKIKDVSVETLSSTISLHIQQSKTLPIPAGQTRRTLRSVSQPPTSPHVAISETPGSPTSAQMQKSRTLPIPTGQTGKYVRSVSQPPSFFVTQSEDHDSPTSGVKSKIRKIGMSILGKSSDRFDADSTSLEYYSRNVGSTARKQEFQKLRKTIEKLLRRRPHRDNVVLKGIIHATIFGSSLQDICQDEGTSQTFIPPFITKCITAIERRIKTPGIYKYHSSPADVSKLRYQIEQVQYDLYSEKWTVYTIADILLLFLKEMKEPLLPTSLLSICQLKTDASKMQMKYALDKLPRWNHDTFRFICRHFKTVVSNSGENQMDVQSLVEAVGSSLMDIQDCTKAFSLTTQRAMERADEILSFCLVEYDFIFFYV